MEPDDLRLRGVSVPTYPTPVSVETVLERDPPEYRATWILPGPIPADRLILEIDGGADGVKTTAGTLLDGDGDGEVEQTDDFSIRFDVFPCNANGGSHIDSGDLRTVRAGLNTSVTHRGVGNGSYTIHRDVNGDGRINAVDVAEVRRRYLTRMPFTEPTAAATASIPLRPRPVTRGLFSASPVLA